MSIALDIILCMWAVIASLVANHLLNQRDHYRDGWRNKVAMCDEKTKQIARLKHEVETLRRLKSFDIET